VGVNFYDRRGSGQRDRWCRRRGLCPTERPDWRIWRDCGWTNSPRPP